MKARSLLSLLAAVASPAMIMAQAPDAPPPPPLHADGNSAGHHGPAGLAREHDGFSYHHHHRHFAKQWNETAQPGEPRERFHHLAEALKHLRAAGMNDVADHLEAEIRQRHQAEERREAWQHSSEGHGFRHGPEQGSEAGPGAYDVRRQLEYLMRQVQELRQEIHQSRAAEAQRGGHPFQRPQDGRGPQPQARPDQPPGPNAGPGPQGQRPSFPRPEWRNHDGRDGHDAREHGDRPAGPPGPPPANRPSANAPSPESEGVLPELTPPPPAAPQQEQEQDQD